MDRKTYNECIAKGLKGKQLNKEERKLEFCILSKLCSKKSKDRDEARELCLLPKEPKPLKAKAKRNGAKSCEKEALDLAQCMLDYFEEKDIYRQVLNINSVGVAMTNALLECKRCQR